MLKKQRGRRERKNKLIVRKKVEREREREKEKEKEREIRNLTMSVENIILPLIIFFNYLISFIKLAVELIALLYFRPFQEF